MPTPPEIPPHAKQLELVELEYREIDEGLAAFGGLGGMPQLLRSIGAMLGAGTIPPTWTTWLAARVNAREPIVISLSTPTHVWECRIR